jgi:predicted DNA-binding transcriptional regulator YafY
MIAQKNPAARYRIIDQCLRNRLKPYPTMEDLIRAIQFDGIRTSLSTVQKDIKIMKEPFPDGFGAPIKYSKKHSGYFYEDPNYTLKGVPLSDDELDSLKDALDAVKKIGAMRMHATFRNAVNKITATFEHEPSTEQKEEVPRKTVFYEEAPRSTGTDYLELFMNAVKRNIPMSMVYYSYQKKRFQCTVVHTLFIKEFQDRWYVVAYSEKHQAVRVFGLDRVYDPVMVNIPFQFTPREAYAHFEEMYGVTPLKDLTPITTVFTANPKRSNYLRAVPLHKTQQILKINENGSRQFSYELILTEEWLERLLSMGNSIKVEKPKWLVTLINQRTQR